MKLSYGDNMTLHLDNFTKFHKYFYKNSKNPKILKIIITGKMFTIFSLT